MGIKTTLLPSDKLKPLYSDASSLEFGQIFTDYMFTMHNNQTHGGWHSPEIKPYQPLALDPAAFVFHYSQEVFEGQKAYKTRAGKIFLFRPRENARRFNQSLKRMCMPEIDEDDFLRYECELLKLEKRWIPTQKGTALYVRPTAIASEAGLGVRPAQEYIFFIILSPVGPYYKEGFNPIGLWVSREYSRAGEGGTGAVKTGGNYGGSLAATKMATEKGYSQVLWLDAKEHRYVEEVGAMNIFFIIQDKIITPPLSGSILPGITRKSLLEIAPEMGVEVEERSLTIDEVIEGIQNGKVSEVFGAGTAAVISPVGRINVDGKDYFINNNETGFWANKFFDTLTAIQYGEKEDKNNWMFEVK